MKKVEVLLLSSGVTPYFEWHRGLEKRLQSKISAYVDRVALGGAKNNIRPLGDGVCEIKVDFGPGYRIYFAEIGRELILILLGGDKSTQAQDIAKAKDYWRIYVSSR